MNLKKKKKKKKKNMPGKNVDEREEGEFIIPLVVGTIARPTKECLPKKEGGHRWHQFVTYIRGDNDTPLTDLIDKVEFRLHKDLQDPIRLLTKEPYEVTDRAWGEFELTIKITLNEKTFGEKLPVATLVSHRLFLWRHVVGQHTVPGNGGNDSSFCHHPEKNSNQLPTVYEIHDEIIITNLLKSARKRLNIALKAPYVHPTGPRGWDIWNQIRDYRPPWMLNEAHQLERFDAILSSLEEHIKQKEKTLEELSWKKGSLLQEASLIKRRRKDPLPL